MFLVSVCGSGEEPGCLFGVCGVGAARLWVEAFFALAWGAANLAKGRLLQLPLAKGDLICCNIPDDIDIHAEVIVD